MFQEKKMLSENAELSLSELGLNRYEARVYLTLITEGTATAKNISDTTGIPYGKVYEIIDTLSRKGFVTILPSKPVKVQALSPIEVAANVKKNFQRKFRNVENLVARELEPIFTKTKQFADPKAVFWILNGRATINRKVEEMIEKSLKHVYIFASGKSAKRLRALRETLKKAKARGVDIMISAAIKNNPDCLKDFSFCEVRHTNGASNNMFSVDGRECVLVESIPDDESFMYGRDLGIWVQSPSFTKFIENLFASHFQNAKEVNNSLKTIKAR